MTTRPVRCPIKGCSHTFEHGIMGWDSHVGSLENHPQWHPQMPDPSRRKNAFHMQFPAFFEQALTKRPSGFYAKVEVPAAKKAKVG